MFRLKLASCMAENTEELCQVLAVYLQSQLGVPTECVTDVPWQERERLFDQGEIQLLWLCGLPYVHKADLEQSRTELLVVPVPVGERYQGQPVYFSDVMVRRSSPFQCFLDLCGGSWAFNEPRSHSGFNVVRAYLAELGQRAGFFGEVIESGAHSASLEMVLSGRIDGAAIDSTVLEWIVAEREGIGRQIRVIETIGPSPIPPWVISKQVSLDLRCELRSILLDLALEQRGREILARARIARFIAAHDADYDPIRRMARKAERVMLA
ncbi:MAG: phosphate ABC transporter substrate-binding protein [Deltaproteobacteria bacterium]|nr:MAG: phosphate ABC transporter substrate-binding protein [Deltaproteobacteria bacterium]